MKGDLTIGSLCIVVVFSVIISYIFNYEDIAKTCPNCHLKDSLYQKCNGQIAKYNQDTLTNTNFEMR